MDYAKAVLGIKYAYTIDIRQHINSTKYLPTNYEIYPIANEIFQGTT